MASGAWAYTDTSSYSIGSEYGGGKTLEYLKEVSVCGIKYRILSLLGRGGFSKVYECLDPENKRRAIKCIDYDGTNQDNYETYEKEVNLLMGLDDCPKVIQVFGAEHCTEDKMLYAVMERGEIDLENLLQTGGVSKLKRKFYWKEMLLAVQELHKRGIVHADLKPSNFVLVEGSLKIIDLGLARLLKRNARSVTCDAMAGTVEFMSPEAFLENEEDDKIKIGTFSDVWSLGCILYALLYGITPFENIKTFVSKLKAIGDERHEIPYRPVDRDDLLVLDCVKKCLQRDYTRRATIPELLIHQYINPDFNTAAMHSLKLTDSLMGMAKR